MLIKLIELDKINLLEKKIILFFGKNEESKFEQINLIIKKKKNSSVIKLTEKDIFENIETFFESTASKSFFDTEKIIIINQVTDKILIIIEKITKVFLEDVIIIINAEQLDKKSKLRNFFEKNKDYISVPFYPDSRETIYKFAYNFLKKKNILISQSDLNILISRCNDERSVLKKELEKIELFSFSKKINSDNLRKITNLIENHHISDLIDFCLSKNKKQAINILNENNFNQEDSIIIVKTLLNKMKRLHHLTIQNKINRNIDKTISEAKPAIFWKDKAIIKLQMEKWSLLEIKEILFSINEVELKIKKNIYSSINIISDYLINLSSTRINN